MLFIEDTGLIPTQELAAVCDPSSNSPFGSVDTSDASIHVDKHATVIETPLINTLIKYCASRSTRSSVLNSRVISVGSEGS